MTLRGRFHHLCSRLKLLRCAQVGRAPSISGRVWIHGAGRVILGDRVCIDASRVPVELHAGEGAVIIIGDDVKIEGGTSIEAQGRVTIGERCRLGRFCKIMDNHFHPLKGNRLRRPESTPVVIEPEAEIGYRATILAGAQIKRGASVRPGTVVRAPPPAALRRESHPPQGDR